MNNNPANKNVNALINDKDNTIRQPRWAEKSANQANVKNALINDNCIIIRQK